MIRMIARVKFVWKGNRRVRDSLRMKEERRSPGTCALGRLRADGGSIYRRLKILRVIHWWLHAKIKHIFSEEQKRGFDIFKTYKASKNIPVTESWHCGLTTDVSESFKKFLRTEGIQHQLTILYTPQQNGLAERNNRTFVEKAHCLLANAGFPKKFWVEACSTATYLIIDWWINRRQNGSTAGLHAKFGREINPTKLVSFKSFWL